MREKYAAKFQNCSVSLTVKNLLSVKELFNFLQTKLERLLEPRPGPLQLEHKITA